ncbi:hypothetical protein DER29_3515 [Micromonospora sp. M71_S20]|nr:hypothetical protein DER29_3515 [Micromonospora sp. M71_S20]
MRRPTCRRPPVTGPEAISPPPRPGVPVARFLVRQGAAVGAGVLSAALPREPAAAADRAAVAPAAAAPGDRSPGVSARPG